MNVDIVASEKDFVRDIIDPKETFDPYSTYSITRAVKRYLKIVGTKKKIKSARELIKYILRNKFDTHINKNP